MNQIATWNPLTSWRHRTIDWIRVNISREDLKRFTKRSDIKGLTYSLAFLLLIGATGGFSYFAFANGYWGLLVLGLYVHGTFYNFFGNALHELSHNTVFASKALNIGVTNLFGWLYWPFNPHMYRASHQKFHHRYTLLQESDGEDVPNYVELTPKLVFNLFFKVFHIKDLAYNLYRLVTITPTTKGWRGRGFKQDWWEQFVLEKASEKERAQIRRLAVADLVGHLAFVAICIALGYWFIPILVTFAPFYGATFMSYMAGIHQHAACEANEADFRISCGDAKLDPLTSFLYWRMEYHIEHHMFAAIPCYNLRAFSTFVADQLPPKEPAIPRILKLHKACKEKFGSYQVWRDTHGIYKGY
jgi:fatty acid desaturase